MLTRWDKSMVLGNLGTIVHELLESKFRLE